MRQFLKFTLLIFQSYFDYIFITIFKECEKLYSEKDDPKLFAVMIFFMFVFFMSMPIFIFILNINYTIISIDKWMFVLFGTIGLLLLKEFYFTDKKIKGLKREFKEKKIRRFYNIITWVSSTVIFIILLLHLRTL